jgi:hypothetical protein
MHALRRHFLHEGPLFASAKNLDKNAIIHFLQLLQFFANLADEACNPVALDQGCQMVSFQTKNPNLRKLLGGV